jgi:Carboxypeptidase regulatory-like domain/TonB-dependent Receptor Plug Domain
MTQTIDSSNLLSPKAKAVVLTFFFLFVSLFYADRAHAQAAGTGTIQGTVLDPSGANVGGATVTATNNGTGLKSTQKTSSAGTYVLSALPPGDYNLDVSMAGFAPYLQEHITLDALTQLGLNVSLKVGSEQQKVVVSSNDLPDLYTENGTVENTIPQATYEALPIAMNGGPKSPTAFLSLVPGVSQPGGGDGFGLDFNGGTGVSAQIYINGLPLVSSELQGGWENLAAITTEDIDQFQVITSGVPAFYDGQGIANLVYKSGTNHFHGVVFENIRNTAFDAKGFFTTGPTPVEHQNEYGAAVGGPIWRDKIFFFGSYDGFKVVTGSSPTFVTIPTVAERTGDFSAFPNVIYDPRTTTTVNGVTTRTPFPGNQVPVNSAVAAKIQSFLPTPQNSNLSNNYFNTYTDGTTQKAYLAKVDADLTHGNRGSFLFSRSSSVPLSLGTVLPVPYSSARTSQAIQYIAQVNDTQVITPKLLNLLGINFLRVSSINKNPTEGGGWPAKLGLTGLPDGQLTDIFPMESFSGPNSPTGWDQGNTGFAEIPASEVIQDNVQWIKGRHSFTFGGQIIYQQENLQLPSQWNNGLVFNNSETGGFITTGPSAGSLDPTTGNAYASFLLGLVDNASFLDASVQGTGGRWQNYAVYAQDDWKVTPRLTVNLGLRYTIPKTFTEVHNRTSWFNPDFPNSAASNAPGIIQFAGHGPDSCNCRTNVATHYLTFGPRVGFAYRVTPVTVVRSSFAIVHFNGASLGGNGQQQGVGLQGYSAAPTFSTGDGGITPAFQLDNGIPAYQHPPFFSPTLATGYTTEMPGDNGSYSYNRPKTAGRSPYTEQWALTLEREFPGSFVVNLTYAGTSSHFTGLDGGVGIYSNQVDPSYFKLGSLLNQPLNAATLAQANAIIPGIKIPFANFVGSIGQALRPFPQYDALGSTFEGPDPWSNFGTQSYNALQATVTHSFKNGLYLLASYSWSKEMDTGGDTVQFFGADARSAYEWNKERSAGYIDTPQALTITEVYELPVGRGKTFNVSNRLLDSVVGNWQISGIESYTEGQPLTSIAAACTNNPYGGHKGVIGNGTSGCYADYAPGGPAVKLGNIGSGTPGSTPYFNVNAFANPAPYSFGDTPRTMADRSLRNQTYMNEDIALSKTFPIRESMRLQIKADAFNIFNRSIFGGVNTDITTPSFGQVSSQANSARKLQLEGYFRF